MNILAVDTAGKTAGVALLQDDRLLYEVYLDGGMTHSETLFARKLLARNSTPCRVSRRFLGSTFTLTSTSSR